MRDQILLSGDAEALARHARDWLVDLIQSQLSTSSDNFVLALSGGSTPRRLFQLLSELPKGQVDWQRVILLWGDKRNVPPEHVESNYRMVRENLLEHIQIPSENVLAVPEPGGPPHLAAQRYEEQIRKYVSGDPQGSPHLDCVLLGLGDDVHTASLFPGSTALTEKDRLVVENHVDKLDTWRITFSPPFINAAANVAFLVAGTGKQSALNSLWHAPFDPDLYPAQLIRPTHGRLIFFLDKSAVGSIPIPESAHVELIG